MKTVKTLLVATALVMASAVGGPALAQDQSPAQGSSAQGSPAQGSPAPGVSMWGPHGMMGFPGMGPGMMGHMMGPGMMGPGGFWHAMMAGGPGKAMCGAMASHIDGRLAYAKAELKITPEQETLWNAYATAARDNAFAMTTHCTTMMSKRGETISLPERLDLHEQFMAAHLDAVRAMNNALKPLYAALSDDQKKTADQMFWGPMGM